MGLGLGLGFELGLGLGLGLGLVEGRELGEGLGLGLGVRVRAARPAGAAEVLHAARQPQLRRRVRLPRPRANRVSPEQAWCCSVVGAIAPLV